MRVLFVGLLWLLVITGSLAAAAWVLVPLDERVTVAWPVEPERQGNQDQLSLFCETPRARFSATRRLMPASYALRTPADVTDLLRSVTRGAARAVDGRVLSTRELPIGEAAGLETTYVVTDAKGNNGPVAYKRAWVLDHTLYLLDFAPHREGKHAQEDQAQFFSSVQVAPAPSPPPPPAAPTPVARSPRARRR